MKNEYCKFVALSLNQTIVLKLLHPCLSFDQLLKLTYHFKIQWVVGLGV